MLWFFEEPLSPLSGYVVCSKFLDLDEAVNTIASQIFKMALLRTAFILDGPKALCVRHRT